MLAPLLTRIRNRDAKAIAGRSTAIVAVLTALLVVSAVVVRSSARTEASLDFGDGSAWLPSTVIGGISLLDGSSGSVVASLGIADAGDVVKIVEWGADALIVNETTGTLGRLDASTWSIETGLVQFGDAGAPLDVVAGDGSGWIIKPGSIAPLDLDSMAQRSPIAFGSSFYDGIVDRDGSLIVSSTEPDAAVRRATVDGLVEDIDGLDGPVALTEVGGGVVGVDLDDRRVWVEGRGVVCDRLELPVDAQLSVEASGDDLLVIADTGGMMIWNPTTSGCPSTTDFITMDGGTFGTPAVTQGWAAVADEARAELIVLDLEAKTLIDRRSLDGVEAGSSIDLVAENGTIWFNDPNSAAAGLVRPDGEVLPVAKYDEGSDSGFVAAPVDTPDEGGDEIEVAGRQQEPQPLDEQEEPQPEETDPVDEPSRPEPVDPGEPTEPPVEPPAPTEPPVDPPGPTEPPVDPPGPTEPPIDPPGPIDPPVEPPVEPPTEQIVQIQLGTTANPAIVGEAVTIQAITIAGEPRFYEFNTSPFLEPQPIEDPGFATYVFPSPGEYRVTAEGCDVDENCGFAATSITVVDGQVERRAGIGNPGVVTAGREVQLSNTNQGENITQMRWSFGEGATPATSTDPNPTVVWNTPGDKTVELTIEGPSSCGPDVCTNDVSPIDTTSRVVTVVADTAPYDVDISGSVTVTVGTQQTYTASTADPRGVPAPHWNVSGAAQTTPRGDEIDVTWNATGTFEITFTSDTGSAEGSGSLTVTVVEPDVPFSVNLSGSTNLEVGQVGNFSVSSIGGTADSYAWNATGSTPSVSGDQTSATVSWAAAGTYTVDVTGTGADGSDSDSITVTVTDPAPSVDPFNIACSASSAESGNWVMCPLQGDASLFTDYSWSFSWPNPADANSWAASAHEMHVGYLGTGTVTLTLTATHVATGTPVSDSASITYSAPAADPAPDVTINGSTTVETGQAVNFSYTNAGGSITSTSWSADGQSGGSGDTYSATWGAPGTYAVNLTVSGPGGNDSTQITVTVTDPAPVPATFGISCQAATAPGDSNVLCNLVGSAADFSGLSWSVSVGSSWLNGGNPAENWVSGPAGFTMTVTVSGTEIATGAPRSASFNITWT